ncbi:TetR/AcrR family transcriptional regulator [Nocardioides speluncae]|uniref:TetR/AcrR family transcriptional regulator n=1 Tax=Nocardioides speluncae TaxID=2670337 RepID=UPI000D693FEB|nr:TetR/AcrR family transcriptional regulator [Nocardioides speluncae]
MPRNFDTGLRADLLYDAICQLIAQGGVGAATTRGVARTAGLSTSSLRHHFDDRGRLLRYVLTRATRSFGPQGWIPAPGDPRRGRSMAHSLLKGLLPLDENSYRSAVVTGDLIAAARTDPTLAAAAEGAEHRLAELCELALAWFRWETSAELDEIELAHLQAVVDGLRRRLCDPHVPLDHDLACAVLQRHLDLMSD